MIKKRYIMYLIFIISLSLASCSSSPNGLINNNNSFTINDLEVGDRIIDNSWTWNLLTGYGYTPWSYDVDKSLVWIVVAKDHYGSTVTLMTEEVIAYHYFDTSMLSNGLMAGQNHWGNSGQDSSFGIRTWLNSTHKQANEGFYHAFSPQFKQFVVDTTLDNADYANGATYTTVDKVFIASNTELGDVNHQDTYVIGKVFEYFKNVEREVRLANIPNDRYGTQYWTRSPINRGYRVVGMVMQNGDFADSFADFSNVGVRPVINVSKNLPLNKIVNSDGVYEVDYSN